MKAVRIHEYGGHEVLAYEDAPRPTPGPGEVLIQVHASSVNLFDCAVHAGYLHPFFNYTFPLIVGTDVSGVVEEAGEGVTDISQGDLVYTRAGVFRDGGNAEYALALASDVAAKPQSIDHVHSAAIPHVGLAAWYALIDLANLSEGQTILIHGAAGGVGHIAVQLARLRGAKVIGTASVNLDFLHELGVDEAIDYSTTAFEEVVKDVDVVLDLIGGDTQQRSWKVLKPGGILITTQTYPPPEEMAIAHGVRRGHVDRTPQMRMALTEFAKMVDAGQIKPHVSTIFPLADVQKAHELIASMHTRGKIILQIVN